MATIARRNVIVEFNADTSQFNRAANQVEREVTGLQRVFNNASGTFAGLFAFDIAGRLASGLQELSTRAVNLAISAEQTQVAFETFLGSAEAARDVIAELNQFSELTPFEPAEVIKAGQSLLAFGVEANKVTDSLRAIGDISAGTGNQLGEIAEIFGKARVQGRLFGEDINQLTGRGIPIIGELAAQFGVAEDQVKKLVSEGQVGFPQLEKAFISLTSEGGRFFELTQRQSESLGGRISTLRGVFDALLRDIGTQLLPILKDLTERFISIISAINPDAVIRFTKAILAGVAAFISYNTVVKAGAALTKAWRAATLLAAAAQANFTGNTGRATAAMRLFNTAVKANPLGLLVTGLTAAAGAYAAFGSSASDAADSQDEFNAATAEGSRLLGAVQDIENRAFTISKLNKEQAQQLREDIEEEIRLNEAKEARLLIISESFRDQRRRALEVEESERTAGDRDIIANAEELARNVQINSENITEAQVKENFKRLKAARDIANARIDILKKQNSELTKEQRKALEKEREEFEKSLIDFAVRNQEATNRRLRNEERIIELQNELRDAQLQKDRERLEARLELEREFLRDKLELDEDSVDEEERMADSRLQNIDKRAELEKQGREKTNQELLEIDIKAIEDKLQVENIRVEDEIELENQLQQKRQELADLRIQQNIEAAQQITQATIAGFNQVVDALQEANERQIELIEGQVEAQEERVEAALKLAEEGNTEILELEEKRLNELEQKREAALIRQQRLDAIEIATQQAVAVAQSIAAVARAFNSPAGLITGIATSIALTAQIAAAIISTRQAFGSIGAFAEGTEFFDGVGGPKSDSNLAFISRGERIVPADKNNKYFSTLNEFQNGTPMADMLHNIAQGGPVVAQSGGRASGGYDMGRLEKEMKSMNKSISKLGMSVTLDQDGFQAHFNRLARKKKKLRNRIG